MSKTDYKVIIVGTGFAGLGMGIKLKEAGYDDFLILERASEVGGTWRDNHYPGCACDVPSHLYSFSFEQNPDWSRRYASWSEIGQYLRDTTQKYGLYPHIQFNAAMKSARYDEANGIWTVDTGETTYTAQIVVSAVGPLSNAAYPNVKGLNKFKGKTFHSADWDHDYDLKGKKVAVIGTGASAIQFVPEVAKVAGEMTLFQRTPPWVIPKPDWEISGLSKKLYRHMPFVRQANRAMIYWTQEVMLPLFLHSDSKLGSFGEALSKAYIRKSIRDPETRAKVTPDYKIGCKRLLLSNNYFQALDKDHVNVVTDGIAEVTAKGIKTNSGEEVNVDAIIYGTGFKVSEPMMGIDVVGRGGRNLNEVWQKNGFESYLGTSMSGFPNFYTLAGTNTGIGHTSLVFMIEAQITYLMQLIQKMDHLQVKSIDLQESVQNDFNREIQAKMDGTVWTSGCNSWYLADTGKNFTIWPDYTFRFWRRTREFDLACYDVEYCDAEVESGTQKETVAQASLASA